MDIIKRLEETTAEEFGPERDDEAYERFIDLYHDGNIELAYKIFEERPGLIGSLSFNEAQSFASDLYLRGRIDEYRDVRRIVLKNVEGLKKKLKDETLQERFKNLIDEMRNQENRGIE